MPDDRTSTAADSRLLHFEDCRSAIDQLFADAVASRGEVALQQFLECAARFTNLSIYNTMLVQIQRPGATAVGSRREWEKKGRAVAADAIPVVVLQPFGPVRFLYELGDTTGDPLPGSEQLSIFAEGAPTAAANRPRLTKKTGIALTVSTRRCVIGGTLLAKFDAAIAGVCSRYRRTAAR